MSNDDVYERFKEVTENIGELKGSRLFRSSAPNYDYTPGEDSDRTQFFNNAAKTFLRDNNINAIVSMNEYNYTVRQPDTFNMLEEIDCQYKHLPVIDFKSPTIKDFRDAITFMKSISDGMILTHCGYGEGRTGTLVSAVQLWSTGGIKPTKDQVKANYNGVEDQSQKDTLEDWRKRIQQGDAL